MWFVGPVGFTFFVNSRSTLSGNYGVICHDRSRIWSRGEVNGKFQEISKLRRRIFPGPSHSSLVTRGVERLEFVWLRLQVPSTDTLFAVLRR